MKRWRGLPNSAPIISVVMPVFNRFSALARTLAGIEAQEDVSPYALEVILIDNNSTEPGLHDMVRSAVSDLAVTVIHQPRHLHPFSLCRARNAGIALARGTWIWSLDSDCIPHPRAAHAFLSAIGAEKKSVMCTGERVFVDAEGITPADIAARPRALEQLPLVASESNYLLVKDRRFPRILDLPDVEQPWDLLHGGNTVFTREAAQRVGGYDERFDGFWGYEDDEFAYRMVSLAGITPLLVPNLVVYHQECPDPNGHQINRKDKSTNPNWTLACEVIPGYREYKMRTYADAGIHVNV